MILTIDPNMVVIALVGLALLIGGWFSVRWLPSVEKARLSRAEIVMGEDEPKEITSAAKNVAQIWINERADAHGYRIAIEFSYPVRMPAECLFACSSPDVRCELEAIGPNVAVVKTTGNAPGHILTFTFGKGASRGASKAA